MGNENNAFAFKGRDGAEIAAYRWGAAKPRGVLQLAHGMGEHALRYPPALAGLMEAGWAIYANDHRGHGRTVKNAEALGDFGPEGAAIVIDDMAKLADVARSDHPGLPLVFLGHSMGSFLGQSYLLDHSDKLAGAALSGSAALDRLANIAADPRGLEALNAPFEPARTPFDWLSRDTGEVDKYIADPLCGFSLNQASQTSLFGAMMRLADPNEIARIRKGFPVYIFAGTLDPVNNHLAWLTPLIDRYKAAGLDVSADLYGNARHEVLNETNRAEVIANLLAWLERFTR